MLLISSLSWRVYASTATVDNVLGLSNSLRALVVPVMFYEGRWAILFLCVLGASCRFLYFSRLFTNVHGDSYVLLLYPCPRDHKQKSFRNTLTALRFPGRTLPFPTRLSMSSRSFRPHRGPAHSCYCCCCYPLRARPSPELALPTPPWTSS